MPGAVADAGRPDAAGACDLHFHLGCFASSSDHRKEPSPSCGFPRALHHPRADWPRASVVASASRRRHVRPSWSQPSNGPGFGAALREPPCKPQLLEASGLSGSVSRSVPAPAPPSPGPAGTGRPVVELRWIAFAEVLLKVAQPAGDVSTQPAFGKEPEAGRRMVANPLRIHELPHAPACTERDAASHQRPPHDCQDIPQGVPKLLPCRPVRIPVSHLTHLQPWRPNPGDRDHP